MVHHIGMDTSPSPRFATIIVTTVLVSGLVTGVAGFGAGWYTHQHRVESALGEATENNDRGAESHAPAAEPVDAGPPEPGDPTDGVFEYEVHGIDYVDSYRENEWCSETHTPDGEYAVIEITAKNVSNNPEYPPEWGQMAYDDAGAAYGADENVCYGTEETNPGQSVTYELLYDVPDGVEMTVIELVSDTAPTVAVVGIP